MNATRIKRVLASGVFAISMVAASAFIFELGARSQKRLKQQQTGITHVEGGTPCNRC
jgi:hypothetical protein